MLKVISISTFNFFVRNYSAVKLSMTSYINKKSVEINRSILITHGLLGSKQNWNSIAKNLNSKFKEVVTIDLRNHGDSPHNDNVSIEAMAEDLGQVLSLGNYKDPILVGHSLGGKVAMYLALSQPSLLSSLVVVDIAPVVTHQIAHYKTYLDTMASAHIDQTLSLPVNRRNISEHLTKCVQDPGIRNFLLTNLDKDENTNVIKWRVNIEALIKGLGRLAEFPVVIGARYGGATLFVSGANSDHIRDADWPRIKDLFPRATLEVVEGAGHWVHADKPHQFIDVLLRFASAGSDTV